MPLTFNINWTLPGLIAAIYALLLLLLYIFQDAFVFVKANPNDLAYQLYSDQSADRAINGVQLQGWRIESSQTEPKNIVLYFGGNGQDNALMIDTLQDIETSAIYSFNYRGYGLSEGTPSEANLYADATALFDSVFAENQDAKIIVIGQSLGSAIAGHLATQRNVHKLVLISPVSSIRRIAQDRFYLWIPNIIVKHKFNLVRSAERIQTKTLVIVGLEDTVVSNKHSKLTFEALDGDKAWVEVPKAGHNDIFMFKETLDRINGFVGES